MDRAQEAGHAGHRRAEELTRPLVIAHRGARGREPENTLAAFRAARALGADAVELDIQTTRDGRFVVHHDAEAQGLVIPAATLEDVRRLRLPNGEPIPTLEEALAGILPDLLAFVEVKTLPAEHDAALLAVLDASSAPARAAVHAFDHRIPHRLRRRRPDLATGVLAVAYAVDPVRAALDAGAKALWQHWETVDQGLVATAHAAGLVVYAWSEGAMPLRRLVELGVDGLCTDHPDEGRLAVDSPVL